MKNLSENVKRIFSEELWSRFRPDQFDRFNLFDMPASFRKDWEDRAAAVLETTINRAKEVIVSERHFTALVDGFSEVKALNEGVAENSLEDIINYVLKEIKESRGD